MQKSFPQIQRRDHIYKNMVINSAGYLFEKCPGWKFSRRQCKYVSEKDAIFPPISVVLFFHPIVFPALKLELLLKLIINGNDWSMGKIIMIPSKTPM